MLVQIPVENLLPWAHLCNSFSAHAVCSFYHGETTDITHSFFCHIFSILPRNRLLNSLIYLDYIFILPNLIWISLNFLLPLLKVLFFPHCLNKNTILSRKHLANINQNSWEIGISKEENPGYLRNPKAIFWDTVFNHIFPLLLY